MPWRAGGFRVVCLLGEPTRRRPVLPGPAPPGPPRRAPCRSDPLRYVRVLDSTSQVSSQERRASVVLRKNPVLNCWSRSLIPFTQDLVRPCFRRVVQGGCFPPSVSTTKGRALGAPLRPAPIPLRHAAPRSSARTRLAPLGPARPGPARPRHAAPHSAPQVG